MIASDPFHRQPAVYYEPLNGLSAYDVAADGTLTGRWYCDIYKPIASPAISPDRDLLYIDDYTGERNEVAVLRLSDDCESARVPLDATLPTVGAIFLGMTDDVFIISIRDPAEAGVM